MESKADFALRDVQKDDLPFIFNSWLKSYRDSPAMGGIPNTVYYAGQHALIEALLERSRVVVACAKDDPTQIMGYALAEYVDDVRLVHWVYVKHTFRGFGIGRALEGAVIGLPSSSPVHYSHRVKTTDRLLKNRTAYVYNPFYLMQVKP